MGMEQTVTFPAGSRPSWPAARDLLAFHGFSLQVRMIDGELAFPDEEPPENWREIRLATPEGLAITLRRDLDRVALVIWGNAEPRLVQAWQALTWALAETGNGQIHTAEGTHTSAEYGSRLNLPAALSRNAK